MEFLPSEFVVFYEQLWDKVVLVEYKGKKPRNSKSERTKLLWEQKIRGVSIFKRFFAGKHNKGSDDYFSRIYDKSKKRYLPFDVAEDLSILKGLFYLGFIQNFDLTNIDKKTDEDIEKIVKETFENFKSASAKQIEAVRLHGPNPPNAGSKELEGVEEVIRKFYSVLHDSERLFEAWNALTPKLQSERWKEGFERFASGYINTKKISGLHIFDFDINGDIVDCKVFYKDKVSNYDCAPLDAIEKLTVGQLKVLISNLENLQEKVERLGGKNFSEIKFKKLFEPHAADFIWWFCEIQPEILNKIFPKKTTDTIYKLVKITCKRIQGIWFIEWIEGAPAYSNQ